MIRIRFAGRGGQGGKTAADLMAMMFYDAVGKDGKFPHVSATTTYGPERRGAPVDSFVRLGTSEIRELGPIANPDIVVVLDETLVYLAQSKVASGLKEGGILLVNSAQIPDEHVKKLSNYNVFTVDASGIALREGLGTIATPIVNTALLGAFVRVSGLGSLEILLEFIDSEMKKKIEENKRVAVRAHSAVHKIERI